MHSLRNYNANNHVTPVQVKKPNIAVTREAPVCPFIKSLLQDQPASHIAFSCHVSLFPPICDSFSHSFTTLIFVKSTGHLLCRMFLNLGLFEVSQRLDWGYIFLAKPHRTVPFSVQWHQLVYAVLTSWSLNPSGVFSWVVTTFPFVAVSCGDTLYIFLVMFCPLCPALINDSYLDNFLLILYLLSLLIDILL